MQTPRIPDNETERLEALRRSNLLHTPKDAVFDRVCQMAARLMHTPMSSISLVDEDQQWFKSQVGSAVESIPRDISFCGHAINEDEMMVVPDTALDARFVDNPLVTGEPHVRFYAGAPLKNADDYVLGNLCVVDTKPRYDFDDDDRQTLRELSEVLSSWIKMRASAGYLDAATGTYTLQRMHETLNAELHKLASNPRAVAGYVGVVDVAMPRQMHDLTQVMGYQLTERFIVECISRLSAAIGSDRDLYRIGMFRFGFFMNEQTGPEVERKLDRLIATLREPFHSTVGILIAPSATMGVAPLKKAAGGAEEHLRQAAVAADDAWESNRAWAFHTPDRDARRQRKLQLLIDLPAALAAPDQLHLEYQPKIDLASGACTGVEALLRWQHDSLGTVSPVELIEAAEKTALMRPLTDWVLDTALAQCVQWRAAGLTLQIAVNLSAHDLTDPDIVRRVQERLHKHQLSGASLELEFTESLLIRNLDAVIPTLQQLHELGVSTAIDDFGTGYCNLSYLQKLNVGKIKIDRRFVQELDDDPRTQTLTRAIINLAHDLGYQVVAEGVETRKTLALLGAWNSEQAQGYLFSKPLRPTALFDWAQDNTTLSPEPAEPHQTQRRH
ncbi:sensor domain-containing phosphodiesterase [Salinisphaera aquimarina]|uniref:EAL domain-containing protein n=1 Tax=Salinisphaera aquimarina TaxID=2094031 RepID=A0ABV7EMJ6_9GAMM